MSLTEFYTKNIVKRLENTTLNKYIYFLIMHLPRTAPKEILGELFLGWNLIF